MAPCGSCGRENGPDAKFCENCGTRLGSPLPPPPAAPGTLGDEIERASKKMGEAFGQMGKTWGEEAGKSGQKLGAWWDHTLGIAAPVAAGAIGVVVLLFVIIGMGMIASVSEHETFWNDLVSFVEHYLWLFVGLIFLNSFSNYFHRRYRKTWRWVIPLPIAVGSVGWFWILAQVLEIAQVDLGHPRLGDLAEVIEILLPVLFILVLILGYLMVFWITIGERGDEPPRYGKYGRLR